MTIHSDSLSSLLASEDSELRHDLKKMLDDRTIFAGATLGRKLMTALIVATPPLTPPIVAFLDFKGVTVATSSFLREAIIGFRDYARQSIGNVYPVAANLEPQVLEELEFFVRSRNDVFWVCNLSDAEQVSDARIVGVLDSTQRDTFDAVCSHAPITAPQLAARFPNERIGPTAWNNRLSSLVEKRLLVERRSGKTKSFAPLLEFT